LIAWNLLVG